ncbi:MAG: GNAT family N-acetyltransferase [Patescibacteria group bacterium]|nr:GNAT family N-acetyltransferase [Patescibacteria group bacterium]
MRQNLEIVRFDRPEHEPELSVQAARLVLEIGNYKKTRDVETVLWHMEGRTTLVAVDDNRQVVGTAALKRVNSTLGVLDDVVSDPSMRGDGIGRKVVKTAEEVALSEGILELNLASSLTAASFYKHLGYTQLGERFFRKYL